MTYLLTVGADMKVSDKLSFGAGLAYLLGTEEAGAGDEDGTLTEIDLSMKYALAQNTTYSLGLAYGMVDQFSPEDDDIIVIGNRVDVKF